MKTRSFGFWTFGTLAVLFLAACAAPLAPLPGTPGPGQVTVRLEGTSRTVLPQTVASAVHQYELLGGLVGDSPTSLGTWSSLAGASVTLAAGDWDFELQAQDASAQVLASGTLSSVTLATGSSTTLAFTLTAPASGDGGVDVTVHFPTTAQIDSVTAALTEYPSGSPVTPTTESATVAGTSDSARYQAAGVPTGTYFLTLTLQDATPTTRAVWASIVRVAAYRTSTASVTWTLAEFQRPPAAPSVFAKAGVPDDTATDGTIHFTWHDNSTNEAGFVLSWDDGSTTGDLSIPAGTTAYDWTSAVRGSTYTFSLRATNAIGDSSSVAASGSFTVPVLRTITFDADGGTGSLDPVTREDGHAAALPANTFTKAGNTFAGWALTSGGSLEAADEATYTATADVTLYALWTAATGTGTISATIDTATETTFTFTPSSPTATVGGFLDVSVAQTFDTYAWAIDGSTLSGETADSLHYDTTGLAAGTHHLVLVVTSGGDTFSGDLTFTLTN